VAAGEVNSFKKRLQEGKCRFFRPSAGYFKNVREEECESCLIQPSWRRVHELLNQDEYLRWKHLGLDICLDVGRYLEISEDLGGIADLADGTRNALLTAVEQLLQVMSSDTSNLSRALHDRRERLESELDSFLDQVPFLGIAESSVEGIGRLYAGLAGFYNVSGRLDFNHPQIVDAIHRLGSEVSSPSATTNTGADILRRIVNLATTDRETVDEAPLLQATLAYVCREYRFCLKVIRSELGARDPHGGFGLRFLESLACQNLGIRLQDPALLRESVTLARALAEDEPDNSRAWHLVAFVAIRARKRHSLGVKPQIKEIIRALDCALASNPEPMLHLAILNSRAYAMVVFTEAQSLLPDHGRALIDEMVQVYPVGDWLPRYLNTAGRLLSALAAREENVERKRTLLTEAVHYLGQAVGKAEREAEFQRIDDFAKHLHGAQKELGKLRSKEG
jgi:hypothetical protein